MKDVIICLIALSLTLIGLVFLIKININELIKHLHENNTLELTNDILFVGFLLVSSMAVVFLMFYLPPKLLI